VTDADHPASSRHDATLSLVSAIVRFEHAADITPAERWNELLFPADEPTRRWFEAI
jgi:hypothetical protein